MPEELKPLLEQIDALKTRIDNLEAENKSLKDSVARVTDLNRALLDRRVDTPSKVDENVSKKFDDFMKGE